MSVAGSTIHSFADPLPEPMGRTLVSAWRLKDFEAGGGEAAGAVEAETGGGDWIDVTAPGDVYLALHAAGRLPDPFGDRAEEACAWVEGREWWWRADFEAPSVAVGERLILTFQGLDTFATVWLNREVLGQSDNMFRPATFDIGARAGVGVNRLAVRFTPVAIALAGVAGPTWPVAAGLNAETRRNLVRKAQFGWGWDWGPRLPTVGIWAPVTLEVERAAAIRDVQVTTVEISPRRDRARVRVRVSAEAFASSAPLSAEIVLAGPDGAEAWRGSVALNAGAASAEFIVDSPRLWWTADHGVPDLYALWLALKAGDAVVAERRLKVGIRTICLDTSPDADEPGTSFFRFVLNGTPIFAKGACWIPASSFVAVVDEARYRPLLEMAAQANMNMVRVWGGGVYEHDAFYDLCDEIGLLVWQDFMFACAPYPDGDEAFVDSVRGELAHQIVRLRHHPSLALWCGNNECQAIHGFLNDMAGRGDRLPGERLYDAVMPAAVAELDPATPYWPGSPAGGPSPNSMLAGDVHDWTVWHGIPPAPADRPVGGFDRSPEGVAFTRYAEDMGRFISEYGIQGAPAMQTLERVLPESERRLGSAGLLDRIRDNPKNKIDAMMEPVTGMPQTIEEYVDFTQITQAEGLKFGIEHFRRRTPHCSGSLIWQLNDCWPGVSWSLIDFYGFGKASYFYTRRAYAPVMASFKALGDGGLELWIVNDTPVAVEGALCVAMRSFAGGVDWLEETRFHAEPRRSEPVWRAEPGRLAGGPDRVVTARSSRGQFPANRHFFAPIKNLARGDIAPPRIAVNVLGPYELAVVIAASAYLHFVNILAPDERTRFSDNYFDLAAGEVARIAVTNPESALSPQDIQVRWR